MCAAASLPTNADGGRVGLAHLFPPYSTPEGAMTSTEIWNLVLLVLMVNTFAGTAYLLATTESADTFNEDGWP
jgi:hypothetical protein